MPQNETPEADPKVPVLDRLFIQIPRATPDGYYDECAQSWSHRGAEQFSPVKLNQEM